MTKQIKRLADYTHDREKHTLEFTSGVMDLEDVMDKLQSFLLTKESVATQSVGNVISGHDQVVFKRKLKIKIVGG